MKHFLPLILTVAITNMCICQSNAFSVLETDVVYNQSFDALGSNCKADIDLLNNWAILENGIEKNLLASNSGNTPCNQQYNSGSFNYGYTSNRSLGALPAASENVQLSFKALNSTNFNIQRIAVAYTGKQWYQGNASLEYVVFEIGYFNGDNNLVFQQIDDLTFLSPQFCDDKKKCKDEFELIDAEDNKNQVRLQKQVFLSEIVQPGKELIFRWTWQNLDANTESHALSIDDFEFVFFSEKLETWYMLSTEDDPSKNKSWTSWPNDTPSDIIPNKPGKNGYTESNSRFIVNHSFKPKSDFVFEGDNLQLEFNADFDFDKKAIESYGNNSKIYINSMSQTKGEVIIYGNSSKLIVSNNNSFDILDKSNREFIANVVVKTNANLNFYRHFKKLDKLEFKLDSCYDYSTVLFDNVDKSKDYQIIPAANYYNLHIQDSDGKLNSEIELAGPVEIRNEMTFTPNGDNVTASYPTKFIGANTTLNAPNYSGLGIFYAVEVAENAVLNLGNLYFNDIYNNHIIFDAPFTIYPSAIVNVKANQSLLLEGSNEFTHNGILNVLNNASLILDDGIKPLGTGKTYITRNQPFANRNAFNHWGSPVKNGTFGVASNVNGRLNYIFPNGEEENSDYQRFTGSIPMRVGRGYSAVGNTNTVFIANNPTEINYGSILYSATEEENDGDIENENFYLLSNPYASSLSAYQFLLENSDQIRATVYLFSQVNPFGQYSRSGDNIAVNILGSSDIGSQADSVINTSNFSGFNIASGQGFFVIDKTPDDGRIDINFSRAMQGGINNDFKLNHVAERKKVWVNLYSDSTYTSLLIAEHNKSTLKIDAMDAALAPVANNPLSIWSEVDNHKLAIQSVPDFRENYSLPLAMFTDSAGKFTIDVVQQNLDEIDVILFDSTLNVYHSINQAKYTFYKPNAGELKNRFYLIFKQKTVTELLPITNPINSIFSLDKNYCNKISYNTNSRLITLQSGIKNVQIVNELGLNLMPKMDKLNKTIDININSNQLYIVSYFVENKYCVQKVIAY